jgi:hypothetical protein
MKDKKQFFFTLGKTLLFVLAFLAFAYTYIPRALFGPPGTITSTSHGDTFGHPTVVSPDVVYGSWFS